MIRTITILTVLMGLVVTDTASAGIFSGLMRAGGRAALRKGAQTSARQATKHTASQTARNAAVSATRARTAQAARHLGGGAAKVGTGAAAYGDDLARVSGSLTAQNHRRLMMMAPQLRKSGQTATVVNRLAKAKKPNQVLDQLWKNRGAIAVGAAATAVVVHGDEIAKAGSDIIKAGAESVAKPLIEKSLEQVAEPVAAAIQYGLIALMAVVGLFAAVKLFWLWRLACTAFGMVRRTLSKLTGQSSARADSDAPVMTAS